MEANPKAEAPELESVVIAIDERDSLITQLYKEFNLPNKPKNALGLERSIEAQEQQRLLQESIAIPLDLVRQLAARRGAVVRELMMRELPGERLFVVAPKVISDAAGAAQNRRVEFALH